MSESAAVDTPIINDAITSDDTGFVGDAGDQILDEGVSEESVSEEGSEGSEESTTEVQAETTEELKEEIQEAIEDGATEEEVEDMIREFELKVNGKTYKKKLDLSDEEAVKRELQKAYAGQLAMQEKKQLEKNYESEVQRLLQDPWAVLEELGLNPDELAYGRLQRAVEEEQKSPEQREKEALERELQKMREEREREKEEYEQAKFEQLQQEEAVKLENEISEALDAHERLPKSQKTVMRIADAMMWAMENGFEDVTAEDVIPSVEEEMREELREIFSDMPEDSFEEWIGKKNIERYRQKRLNSIKTASSEDIKPTAKAVEAKKEKKKKEKIKSKDYFRNLGR